MKAEVMHRFFMHVAMLTADLSYCKRDKVGAVLVFDQNILSLGYNGTISKAKNECEDKTGNTIHHLVLHAESNCLARCARLGIATKGASLYVTTMSCVDCAKLSVQAGIIEVWYDKLYRDETGMLVFKEAGILINKL